MIYYKKKNPIKKATVLIKEIFKPKFEKKFSLSKILLSLFIFFILFSSFTYLSYLYLLPKYINENNVKLILNNYILKEKDILSDIDNIQISPNWKLNINIKANYIKLKDLNNKTFLTIQNPSVDVNLFSLFFKNIDFEKISAQDIKLLVNFTKEKRYDACKYLNTKEGNSKFKIKKINVFTNNLTLNLFDENINKNFELNFKNTKFSSNDINSQFNISTKGAIKSNNKEISSLNLKLAIKPNPNTKGEFRKKLINLNYNPLIYAQEYNFFSDIITDLKINPNNKNSTTEGEISLKNLTFNIDNIKLPKNDIVLKFKNNKIHTNCNFNFINNQKININSSASISKNKFIEANIISNEINLNDLNKTLQALNKILNLKLKLDEISTQGSANVDLYIKSNFKTIISKGHLLIKNAKLTHKKTNLTIHSINANINLSNNSINIINTSALINDAKFNLEGKINSDTNMNLKINSDTLNIAQILNLIKILPIKPISLEDYNFKNGTILINSQINGTFKNPQIKTNSTIENLNFKINSTNTNINSDKITFTTNPNQDIKSTLKNTTLNINNNKISIPTLDLIFNNNNIVIPNTKANYENFIVDIDGIVKNYKTKQIETILNLKTNLAKTDLISFKNSPILVLNTNFKQNKLTITNGKLIEKDKLLATINGLIETKANSNPNLNLKLNIVEKTNLSLPKFDNINFNIQGNIALNGELNNPNINGYLDLSDLYYDALKLKIKNATIQAKNSNYHITSKNTFLYDNELAFDSLFFAKNNNLIIDEINLISNYINLDNFKFSNKTANNNEQNNLIINKINGFIGKINTSDLTFDNITFNGNFKNNILSIEKFSLDSLNGKIEGNYDLNCLNQKNKLNLVLKEINIRQLPSSFKKFSIATSGKLSANIEGEFYGFEQNKILNSLIAIIDFDIHNGELTQFAKLERLLQAGNILSQSLLKLTLNSALSAITKQNTGDFKLIEGNIKIQNNIANVNYIKTQGSNMSLFIVGDVNLLTNNGDFKILGKIPQNIVNVMGNFGNYSLNQSFKTNEQNQNLGQKLLTTQIPIEEIENIPNLAYSSSSTPTREFVVIIDGDILSSSSIKYFKFREN